MCKSRSHSTHSYALCSGCSPCICRHLDQLHTFVSFVRALRRLRSLHMRPFPLILRLHPSFHLLSTCTSKLDVIIRWSLSFGHTHTRIVSDPSVGNDYGTSDLGARFTMQWVAWLPCNPVYVSNMPCTFCVAAHVQELMFLTAMYIPSVFHTPPSASLLVVCFSFA